MLRNFTLEYWLDDGWYVGKLKEVPGIFSQGETLEELEDNINDVFRLMMAENEQLVYGDIQVKELTLEVCNGVPLYEN